MATLTELYERVNNSNLRNRIEIALLTKAQTEIDADGANKAYALTLLNQSTAQAVAQYVLRYLVVKYPDVAEPDDAGVTAAVNAVFVTLAGG